MNFCRHFWLYCTAQVINQVITPYIYIEYKILDLDQDL